eukprot:16444159-Heterocapsa_arctica.AAC.1
MACAIVEETNVAEPYKTMATARLSTTPTSNRFQALIQNDDMDDNGDDDNDDIDIDVYIRHDSDIVNTNIATT